MKVQTLMWHDIQGNNARVMATFVEPNKTMAMACALDEAVMAIRNTPDTGVVQKSLTFDGYNVFVDGRLMWRFIVQEQDTIS